MNREISLPLGLVLADPSKMPTLRLKRRSARLWMARKGIKDLGRTARLMPKEFA